VMVMGAGLSGLLLGALLVLGIEAQGRLRRRSAEEPATAAAHAAASPIAQGASASASASAPSPAAQWTQEAFTGPAAGRPEPDAQSQSDLMRVLRMMGQLEKAIDRYGMPR
jgi:predicted lipid-binding transport protein (Tim44 family)